MFVVEHESFVRRRRVRRRRIHAEQLHVDVLELFARIGIGRRRAVRDGLHRNGVAIRIGIRFVARQAVIRVAVRRMIAGVLVEISDQIVE